MTPTATALNKKQQQVLPGVQAADSTAAGAAGAEMDRSTALLRNVDAERVLLRCRLKLEGREGGVLCGLSMTAIALRTALYTQERTSMCSAIESEAKLLEQPLSTQADPLQECRLNCLEQSRQPIA